MSSRTDKDKVKQLQDKCQTVLTTLLRDEDNKYCVDCDSKGPRWASWNIGVFLCIRCAGIHRNLGVHISKVKSVNLDSWTPEQVVSLQQMGNSRARAVYEANLPDNFRRPQSDSSLESFIRAKYEHKKYIAREWVPPTPPKVDWEKEIDEEMEKQRRKKKATSVLSTADKKSAVSGDTLGSVEVPQLPKPTNPSPKASKAVKEAERRDKKDGDLLGLQNGEDNFSGFVSAPPTSASNTEKKDVPDAIKKEEESFFNQVIPSEKEKVKLDKDSILALYGSAPANNFNQFAQVPYAQPVSQASFPAFGAFPQQPQVQQQAFPVMQNGMTQLPAQWPQQQVWPKQQAFSAQPLQNQTPYVANTAQFQNQFANQNQFPAFPQQPVPSSTNQLYQQQQQQAPFQQMTAFNQPPQTMFANQNLSQQFGTLSLGNQTANTGNLWQ